MIIVVQIIVSLLALYFGIGFLFGIYFFIKGAFQLDELITESKWTVRLLLVPGAIGLWPILLLKIINKSRIDS
ncbi:hypothetical protein IWQ47_001849 [Aquimarina sp. EL_43]|uniref:hypothetical protein n=1 Tax=Aquimarina TaxID=290174 RepID=UPI000472F49B|nr:MULTISPECIES: hypothetical protein [Aquimarina]MBG6130068.1 hypothetical protein [Aquimarina sp. EL_35]MBG6148848.1 hypothetical protein [Aquimarina sp. EL_32]MBG6168778.1 hypothetical protein [Aquimarina sp. EL_43]